MNNKIKVANSKHHHHQLSKEQIRIIKQIAQEQSRDVIKEWNRQRAAHLLL